MNLKISKALVRRTTMVLVCVSATWTTSSVRAVQENESATTAEETEANNDGLPAKKKPESTPAPGPGARVSTLGPSLSGDPADLRLDLDAGKLSFGDQEVDLRKILGIEFNHGEKSTDSRPDSRALLLLRSGEEIFATVSGGDESEVAVDFRHLRTSEGSRTVRIELDLLRALTFPARFSSPSQFLSYARSLPGHGRSPIVLETLPWTEDTTGNPDSPDATRSGNGRDRDKSRQKDGENTEETDDRDAVITDEGSELHGIVESIGASSVQFEADSVGPVNLDFKKIRAIRIADIDGDKEIPNSKSLTVILSLADGSLLRGRPLALQDGQLRLHSRALGPVQIGLSEVRHLEFSGGQIQFLSDLNPVQATTRDLFATDKRVQRDASYLRGPLRLRGNVYRKGLGMRSHTRLDYRLDRRFTRFQAVLGIDDTAEVTTFEARRSGGGVALFKVHLDNEVIFEKELSVRDEPVAIDIPVSEGQILGIEVDPSPGLHSLDYADWVDAKLIRK